MKAVFNTIAAIVMMALFASCNLNQSVLQVDVDNMNETCPIDEGDGFALTSVDYDDDANVVTFNFAIEESKLEVQSVEGFGDMLKPEMAKYLMEEKQLKELLTDGIDAGASFVFKIKGKESNTTSECKFSNEDLKKLKSGEYDTSGGSDMTIQGLIRNLNSSMPMKLDEEMTMTKVVDDGNAVIFEIEISGPDLTIDMIRSNSKDFKSGMKEGLSESEMQEELKVFAENNRGVTYRMKDARSGKSHDLEFSLDEVKSMIK